MGKRSTKKATRRKAPRKRGRPSLYTEELAAEICRRLADGESLRSICRDENMPGRTTVTDWSRAEKHPFPAQYARAREDGFYSLADEILEIADDSSIDIDRARLQIDARKWIIAKQCKSFADRVEHTGKEGAPVKVEYSDFELARRAIWLLTCAEEEQKAKQEQQAKARALNGPLPDGGRPPPQPVPPGGFRKPPMN